jgi:dehydrogenase/reductase SDR family member 7B
MNPTRFRGRHAGSVARIKGRTALVTGASSGIGWALAMKLAEAGVGHIGLLARRADRLHMLARAIGPRCAVTVLPADLTDPEATQRAIDTLAERAGGIDLVFANAGASMNARFEDTPMEVHHRMMAVNYFGAVHTAKWSLPHLERSGGGLVFVSSVVGKRGFPTRSGYSASKFAVHALFESLRSEWVGRGVHIGLVAPGFTDTEIRSAALGADGLPRGASAATHGRVMSASDAAAAIVDVAAHRRREVVLTRAGRAMVWLNKLLPSLADRVAARAMADQ